MSKNYEQGETLRAKINGETARMKWSELQRFFASGAVISVTPDLDLVEVAYSIASDDKQAVAQWMAESRVAKVSDAQAEAWMQADASLWAVVVKPWILVQGDQLH